MAGYIGNIPVPQALRNYDVFTATSGQTVFNVKSYDPSFIDVYQNGVKLIDGDDYTATDGNTVVLASGAALNDVVEVISFTTFYPADVVSASAGGTFTGDVAISSTGAFTVPVGTPAQRPTPIKGMFRFNDSDDVFEGYDGTAWGAIGGGADFSSVAEDIIPDADSTRDLGSSSKAWALAYLDAIEPGGTDTTIKRVGGTNTTPIAEGLAKAWVNFNGTGTIATRDSLNLSSLTDNGSGNYTVTFTNAFDNANYAPLIAGGDIATLGRSVGGSSNATRLTSSFDLRTLDAPQANLTDCDTVYSAFFGDLA